MRTAIVTFVSQGANVRNLVWRVCSGFRHVWKGVSGNAGVNSWCWISSTVCVHTCHYKCTLQSNKSMLIIGITSLNNHFEYLISTRWWRLCGQLWWHWWGMIIVVAVIIIIMKKVISGNNTQETHMTIIINIEIFFHYFGFVLGTI